MVQDRDAENHRRQAQRSGRATTPNFRACQDERLHLPQTFFESRNRMRGTRVAAKESDYDKSPALAVRNREAAGSQQTDCRAECRRRECRERFFPANHSRFEAGAPAAVNRKISETNLTQPIEDIACRTIVPDRL